MITSSAILGLALGSLFSGPIVNKGRRTTMILGNILIFFAVILQMKINVYLISTGKLLQGFGSGMILNAMSIMISETIPSKFLGLFGPLTNFGIVLGLSIYMFLALIIP